MEEGAGSFSSAWLIGLRLGRFLCAHVRSSCIAAALAACSIDAVTFKPAGDPITEDCAAAGDEDGNGLADCDDPVCAGVPACRPVCGDGRVEPGEACDDGNLTSGDGCEADCSARVTVVLQPDGAAGKDGRAFSLNPDTPAPNVPLLYASAWTYSGVPAIVRCFLDFDLPPPPPGSTLVRATLSLFADPQNGHSTLSGSNELIVRQITSPWDAATVSWNNQPSSDAVTQLVLPPSTSALQTYDIDVTTFMRRELGAPDQFHGFMFLLQNEQYYRAVIFGSSDHLDPALRPRLVLEYSVVAR